jgi:hypothetical protein
MAIVYGGTEAVNGAFSHPFDWGLTFESLQSVVCARIKSQLWPLKINIDLYLTVFNSALASI